VRLAALITACAMDAARRRDPASSAVVWLFGPDRTAPLRVITVVPIDGRASAQECFDALDRAVAGEARTLAEPPEAAVVLGPRSSSGRWFDAATWDGTDPVRAPYPPSPAEAARPISRSVSTAMRILAQARAARAIALH
jgi:hypothetical protein